jgi:hypothetical protein
MRTSSKSRTCAEAGVDSHFCSCVTWVELRPGSIFAVQLAETTVAAINDFVRDELQQAFELLEATRSVTKAKTDFEAFDDTDLYNGTQRPCALYRFAKVKRALELRGKGETNNEWKNKYSSAE